MFKLTFLDRNIPRFCSFTCEYFVDDIKRFEEEWITLVDDMGRVEDFRRSKEGEFATEFWLNPNIRELNIVQQDKAAEILKEWEQIYSDREVVVHNAYGMFAIFRIKELTVFGRYVYYEGRIIRMFTFRINGIALCKESGSVYEKVYLYESKVPGNKVLKYVGILPDSYESDDFDDYAGECVEALVWYPLIDDKKEENILREEGEIRECVLTDNELDILLRDLVGCNGFEAQRKLRQRTDY